MSALIFDVVIVSVLLVSAAVAFLRGFVKEVLSIAGVVGAVIGAWLLGPRVLPAFNGMFGVAPGEKPQSVWGLIPADLMAMALAYGAAFVFCFVILFIFNHFVSRLVREAGLGAFDRALGVLFGLVRGGVLVVLAYLPFSMMLEENEFPIWVQQAKTRPAIEASADWAQETFGLAPVEIEAEKTKSGLGMLLSPAEKLIEKIPQVDQIQDQGIGYDKVDRLEVERLIEKEIQ